MIRARLIRWLGGDLRLDEFNGMIRYAYERGYNEGLVEGMRVMCVSVEDDHPELRDYCSSATAHIDQIEAQVEKIAELQTA